MSAPLASGIPVLSVVLPLRDGEDFVADALNSLLAQGFPDLEVIVVDDGSRDRGAEIAAGFPGVRVLRQEHQGVAVARNRAIEMARGDLLAFLDHDDRWTPGKLARQVPYLLAHPELGFTVAQQQAFVEAGFPTPGWMRPEHVAGPAAAFVVGTLLCRREVFDRVGPFDPEMSPACDTDWFLRAKRLGVGFELLPDVLLERRIHGTNLTHDVGRMQAQLLRALRRDARERARGTGG